MRRLLIGFLLAGLGVLVGAGFVGTGAVATTPGASPGASAAGPVPQVEGPVTGGNGDIVVQTTGFDLADVGYEASEWFVSGTASSFTSSAPLTEDGEWEVTEGDTAPYRTRIVVYRPVDPERFNGTVVVEWLNVTAGLDAGPTWSMTHTELIRRGYAWVGVSAQVAGVEGGGASIAASQALKLADPVRYGSLTIASDSFSYDIYSQVGRLLRGRAPVDVLELRPRVLLATGASQSAFRLTTYIDAVHPLHRVYDGYFVHSRGGGGAPLAQAPQARIEAPSPTLIRRDVDAPVMVFTAEGDLFGLDAVVAAQRDSRGYRDWQAAGTAHYDTYGLGIAQTDTGDGAADVALFDSMLAPPQQLFGGLFTCGSPINAGPHHYVASAAIAATNRWVVDGVAPPRAPRIEVDAAGTDAVRDEHGIAVGGIRTPQVDAPVAALSGVGQTGSTFCSLFGTTRPFDAPTLASEYATNRAFVQQWTAATRRAVKAGFMLPADAEHVIAAGRQSTIGAP